MENPVCQTSLTLMPWITTAGRRLPGLRIGEVSQWLIRDDAFARQMTLRDQLLAENRKQVFQIEHSRETEIASLSAPLLGVVKNHLQLDRAYRITDKTIVRPDGVSVSIDEDAPLVTIARLVQEDFAILLPRDDGQHILAGAVICFPASWVLAEKIGRTLTALHHPVNRYDDDLARRIERIFTNLPDNRLIERGNYLIYTDPALHQPRPEGIAKPIDPILPRYVRVERQTLRRIGRVGHYRPIVFTIHTSVVRASTLFSQDQTAYETLARLRPELLPAGG